MRNNVTFNFPERFLPLSEEDGILSKDGAQWLVSILKTIPSLEIDPDLCQEDWGVVLRVKRNQRKFWIGLSFWPDGEQAWLVHLHHDSFAWLQRFSTTGKAELEKLILNMDDALKANPSVSNIFWYSEEEIDKPTAVGSPTP